MVLFQIDWSRLRRLFARQGQTGARTEDEQRAPAIATDALCSSSVENT